MTGSPALRLKFDSEGVPTVEKSHIGEPIANGRLVSQEKAEPDANCTIIAVLLSKARTLIIA